MKTRIHRITSKRHQMDKQKTLTEEYRNAILTSNKPAEFLERSFESSKDLGAFLTAKLDEKGLKKAPVIRDAQIGETYAYQIFSGTRNKPDRNYILALCIAMGLDAHETRRALCLGNVGDLYAKNRRDAIILFCVDHGYSLIQTNDELYNNGEETITGAKDQGC